MLVKHRSNGFTVLELLITLAILGIISAIAVPSLMDTLSRMGINSATRTLASTLSLARSEAVKRGQDVSICPTLDGSDCVAGTWAGGWVVFIDKNNDANGDSGSIDVDDTVIRIFESMSGLDLSITPDTNLLVYDNKGYGKNASTLVFKLCPQSGNADNAKEIEISMSGRPRINSNVGSCS